MSVELRHLRALVALAQAENFTVAAAMLGTTQPTLSRTIRQLERDVGVQLVARTTREVALTAEGHQLVASAGTLLAGFDAALAKISPEDASAVRPLRVGWAWAGLGPHTVPLLQQWKQAHSTQIEVSRPTDPVEALRQGRIDAALFRQTLPDAGLDDDLQLRRLFDERLVAALAADDPRAKKTAVTLEELGASTVAVCSTAPTATARLWAQLGYSPDTVLVGSTDEWLTLISLGDAVGVTAEATTYSHRSPEVQYCAIEDAPAVTVSLASPLNDAHPLVDEFAEFARDYFDVLIARGAPPIILTGTPR